ncbi:hypothetical protein Hrubri_4364 [Herbaspirillum rubrisubalbicans M1]|uniref:DUF3644 domain-containing protein n=1 Tax=Herbaspirillum rubrisubalbicans TaxID=80842 RepID=UPI00073A3EA3|nr:DUF3644 domain-containing protein [Herbaspirillum rubrisubalbicans]ALU91509.1 hypothetical protein Hrubri_4364 [Herbaspirillum rubrisubalbicans M1]
MRARSLQMFDKAISAMIAAIEIYNKPTFEYREESFAVLAINAWELLAKAKYLKEHGNKLTSLYVTIKVKTAAGEPAKRVKYKQNRTGNPMTLSLEELAEKLVAAKHMDAEALKNLQALLVIRDSAIHFYNTNPLLSQRLQEIGTATVRNFVIASIDWFDVDFAPYNFHLMPLAFVNPGANAEAIILSREEQRIASFIESLDTGAESKRQYAVSVNIQMTFIKSAAKEAIKVQLSNHPDAVEIQLTEEQLNAKYKYDYRELLAVCAKRYSNFIANKAFHDIRKPLLKDQKYALIRELDPGNPKTATKAFYSEAILTVFDKHYARA